MCVLRIMASYVALLLMCVCLHSAEVQAQTAPEATSTKLSNRHLMVPPRNVDGTIRVTPFLEDPVIWLRDEQQNFYSSMAGALRGVGGKQPISAALMLLLLSFAYGVFHAAGPGHGKAVISGWVLATESQLRRGVLLAFFSAMLQAAVAVIIVSAVLLLFSGAATAARSAANGFEAASYFMIAAVGLYLFWTGLRPIFTKARNLRIHAPHFASAGGRAVGQNFVIVNPVAQFAAGSTHEHGPDCGCEHVHLPAATEVSGDWSLRKAASLTLAAGLRPCMGAILVLLFASAQGIYWAGVLATFIMALGTFITVSAIASLAVYSRRLATRLFDRNGNWLSGLNAALRIAGGLAIFSMGAIMCYALASGSGPTGM